MSMKSINFYKDRYLRHLPTSNCAGCGNGTILNCFARAVDELELNIDKVLCVSGIGCSAWIPSPYFNSDTLHVTHGRALAFATGAKVFNNELTVVVFTGDGDGAGIGGNHLIHAARRNINVTTILVNNFNYAMTGGQLAPTTFFGIRTVTSPYGNPENPFDLCKLVKAAGATYVARWSTYHIRELRKSIKDAISNNGFSFIEVLSQCPTRQRRMFNLRGSVQHEIPAKILEVFKESTYIRKKLKKENYFYIFPKEELELTEKRVSKILTENSIDFEIKVVTRLFLGNVVKVECKDIESFNKSLNLVKGLRGIGRLLKTHIGKIVLGVFVSKKSRDLAESMGKFIKFEESAKT